MKILYKDNNIAVIVKPYGVNSQNANGENIPDMLSCELGCQVLPVHRLDRTTGGVMVYALNRQSAASLTKQLTEKGFNKDYLAVIKGVIEPANGSMVDLLFYDRQKNKAFIAKKERKGVKKAILNYETKDTFNIGQNTYSLLNIELETGRTHQIRVQLASRGYPLCGDRRYGSNDSFSNISLWAHNLSFYHPQTGERLTFSCEPPEDFFNTKS